MRGRVRRHDPAGRSGTRLRKIHRTINGSLGLVLLADAALRLVVIYSFTSGQITQSGLVSQLPFVALIGAWFVVNQGLVVPGSIGVVEQMRRGRAGNVHLLDSCS